MTRKPTRLNANIVAFVPSRAVHLRARLMPVVLVRGPLAAAPSLAALHSATTCYWWINTTPMLPRVLGWQLDTGIRGSDLFHVEDKQGRGHWSATARGLWQVGKAYLAPPCHPWSGTGNKRSITTRLPASGANVPAATASTSSASGLSRRYLARETDSGKRQRQSEESRRLAVSDARRYFVPDGLISMR